MKNLNFRQWINNTLKAFMGFILTSLLGHFLYNVFLGNINTAEPMEAKGRTIVFSLIVFILSTFIIFKIDTLGSLSNKGIDERNLIEKAFRDNNYELDYDKYFADQLKKRLWGYYLAALLSQIPAIINYGLVSAVGLNVFQSPVFLFKFAVPSLFAYEICGPLWFFGPLIYMILFSVSFTALVYFEQKKWLVKPSYMQ